MRDFLYALVEKISVIHNKIMELNDAYEYDFSDKQLHFIVIGLLGMAMVFIIHPIFKLLAKTNHIMVITWIYVFTLIIVLTFAIEIGQKVTKTGVMDFGDIVFGVFGFFLFFALFACIRCVVKGIIKLIKGRTA